MKSFTPPQAKFQLFQDVVVRKETQILEAKVIGLCYVPPLLAIKTDVLPGWEYTVDFLSNSIDKAVMFASEPTEVLFEDDLLEMQEERATV